MREEIILCLLHIPYGARDSLDQVCRLYSQSARSKYIPAQTKMQRDQRLP